MKSARRIYEAYRPDLGRIFLALGLLVLSTAGNLLKPWPLAVIVDSILGGKPLPSLLAWMSDWNKTAVVSVLAASLLFLHLAQGSLSALQSFVTIVTGLKGLARIRVKLFHQLQRLSLRFYTAVSQGDLIYRASWDTYAFQTLFQQGVFALIQAILSLILMLLIMLRLNLALTLLLLGFVPLLMAAMKVFGAKMNRKGLAAHQSDSRVTASFQQGIVAMPLIQSYTRERDEEQKFAQEALAAFNNRRSQHGWEVLYGLMIAVGFGFATAAIAWVGTAQVLAGRLSVGELLVFLAYLGQLYEPLNQLSHVGATVSDANAGTQRVFEILDSPEEVKEIPGAKPIRWVGARGRDVHPNVRSTDETVSRTESHASPEPLQLRGRIQFDRVSFSYVSQTPVLREISLEIAAGESTAIIGPSGVGKTTLLQLLPRFYDPVSGAIRLDGVDIRELRLKDLRSAIAFVFQEAILLPATISENIAYARPDASPEEIEAAARAAHAHEFIARLPDGYKTSVGEGATRLSVGERQRITLARAFLKNAPILLLDEPTSALDPQSEELVASSLAELMKHRTTLLVAHRLTTIRQVQKIVALEQGTISEEGTPAQLLQRTGYYARMNLR